MNGLFKCLVYQFMEDLSDKQLEEAVMMNSGCRWFCGFSLSEKTPDHSLFCIVRERIGASRLSKLFSIMKEAVT